MRVHNLRANMKRSPKSGGIALRKIYRFSSGIISVSAIAYILLLSFPQMLFANSATHGHFTVYSNGLIDKNVVSVLDAAEERLQTSPLYDTSVSRSVYLTDSHGIYALLSHKAYRSFGNTAPLIGNVFINRSDSEQDMVFINRLRDNTRSLSGVIAHEITHLFIRKKYGQFSSMFIPTWKIEGYCEYVAGSSTLTYDEGVALWKAQPTEDTGYQYFKFHMMVKQLLDTESMSVDDLFDSNLDEGEVAAKTLQNLRGH